MDIEKQRTALDNLAIDLEENIDIRLDQLKNKNKVSSKEAVEIIMSELRLMIDLLDKSYNIGLLTIGEFDAHRNELTFTARRKLGLE